MQHSPSRRGGTRRAHGRRPRPKAFLPLAGRAAPPARGATPSRPRPRWRRSSPWCPRTSIATARDLLAPLREADGGGGGRRQRQDSVRAGLEAGCPRASTASCSSTTPRVRSWTPRAHRRGRRGRAPERAPPSPCCPWSTRSSACATAASVETLDRAAAGGGPDARRAFRLRAAGARLRRRPSATA